MLSSYEPIKFRYEAFGGIIQLEKPSALVYVDRDYMRDLGYPESPLWDADDQILTAPTEVHLALTRKCDAGCRHCYMDGGKSCDENSEMGRQGVMAALSKLARMKVFHVAMGGGESTQLPWLFEAAHAARSLGMIPNLTTNGFSITDIDEARKFKVFGQVNVSIDGVGPRYAALRGFDRFKEAVRALTLLRKAGVRMGVNCVVSRDNFNDLDDVFALCKKLKVKQLELLRFKPAGRAAGLAEDHVFKDLTPTQAWDFFPKIMKLAKKYRTPLNIDCSLTPHVYAHKPDKKKLEYFGVFGCYGGNMLCGVHPEGEAVACSFAHGENHKIDDIDKWWGAGETFSAFRHWTEAAPRPCADCRYLTLCQGGCHVVAEHVNGDIFTPDPGCPVVADYMNA